MDKNTDANEQEDASDSGWDTRGLGIRGLHGRADPLGWPSVIFLFLAFVVIGVSVDSLRLTKTLSLAITPLTVLLTVGGSPLLRLIADRASQEKGRDFTTLEKCSMLIALTTTIAIVLILVHVALPSGQFRDVVGVTSACMILLLPIVLLRAKAILRFVKDIGRDMNPDPPLPARANRWAWVVDTAVSIPVILVVTWLLAPRIEQASNEAWPGLVTFWTALVLFYCIYEVASLRIWGRTMGQWLVRVRVAASEDGERPSIARITLRTLLVTLPLFFYLLLPFMQSSESSLIENRVFSYVVVVGFSIAMIFLLLGVISLVWLREIHPRGQGLLDLVSKTVSVPHPRRQRTR